MLLSGVMSGTMVLKPASSSMIPNMLKKYGTPHCPYGNITF